MNDSIQAASVKTVLLDLAATLKSAKARLSELDSKAGDGDMGISMELGATALEQTVTALHSENDVGTLLQACGLAFNKAAPSTMGTLLAVAMLKCGVAVKGRTAIGYPDIIDLLELSANTIHEKGKAQPGDKTVLDALIPAVNELRRQWNAHGDWRRALTAAAQAAEEGAQRTAGMPARMGRARWLGDRSRDAPDPGADMCRLLFRRAAGENDEVRIGEECADETAR